MGLNFNAPVPRKLAEAIRLKSAAGTLKPVFDTESGDGENVVNGISFKPPFAEKTSFTLELPKDFKGRLEPRPAQRRQLSLKVATGDMPPLAKFGGGALWHRRAFCRAAGQSQ